VKRLLQNAIKRMIDPSDESDIPESFGKLLHTRQKAGTKEEAT